MITKMVLENFKSYGGVREVPLALERRCGRAPQSDSCVCVIMFSDWTTPQAVLFDRWSQWLRKVERHRRDALCLWQEGEEAATQQGRSCVDALWMWLIKQPATSTLSHLQVSELIHCSEKFPNLESARVSVHFADIVDQSDNDDAFEIGALRGPPHRAREGYSLLRRPAHSTRSARQRACCDSHGLLEQSVEVPAQ